MSSLRNTVQRRNHKERAQPQERAKWGLLEKRKDYSLRAKDHNAKKRKLKALQQKASERNDDEFYFGMMRGKSERGIKVAERGEDNSGSVAGAGKSLAPDVVKLMKTQDCAYLRTVMQSTRRERERSEREVVLLETGVPVALVDSQGKTVYGEDGTTVLAVPSQVDDKDDDDLSEDGLLDLEDASSAEDEPKAPISKEERASRKKKRHALEVQRRRLEALRDRERDLTVALREVEDQRVRMSGNAGGVNKKGSKFMSRQRQR